MGQHSPKKMRLSPLQREVLWTLEEAGEENLPTVINTVHSKCPANSKIEFVGHFETALRSLLRLELVAAYRDCSQSTSHQIPIPAAEAEALFRLDEVLQWNEAQGYWKWNEEQWGTNRLTLALTSKGENAVTD